MTTPPTNPKINLEDFIKEREAVLAKGDLLELARFLQRYNPRYDCPELKEEVLQVLMHRGRAVEKSLPLRERKASRKWLRDHGHDSLLTPNFTEEELNGEEEEVLPASGTSSNPDDPASPEPEQPVVDVPVVAGSSSETPTG